jgi:hypothetical protein
MNRAGLALAATFVAATLGVGSVLAQTPQPPEMKQVLAGKTFTPPIRGEAAVEFTAPVTRRVKDMVVTRITVRNAAAAPIPRLTISETWYDKSGAVLTGGRGVVNGLLQPGEIQTVVIETPYKAGMNANNYNFSHANGTIKPNRVPKLDVPKEEAAAAAKN